MLRLLGITVMAAFMFGCGSSVEDELIDVDNTSLALSGLYSLHVTPNPMNPTSELAIRLEVGKEIDARLLLIDHEGQVLHTFQDGMFAEGNFDYTYIPTPDLPVGDYYIVLADESNLIIEGMRVISTNDVLSAME